MKVMIDDKIIYNRFFQFIIDSKIYYQLKIYHKSVVHIKD
jgi:hypothetical protein